jgi:hypothetical protein
MSESTAVTARDDTEAREVARQRLTALNVDGWRQEADHGCDGTEESCMATCPVAVQVRVSHDEIIDAVVDAFAERVRAAERERLARIYDERANEWESLALSRSGIGDDAGKSKAYRTAARIARTHTGKAG